MNCLDNTAINLKIGSKEYFIQTEILDEKIPLLLSKTSFKKADTYLNIKDDKIKMFDEDIDVCVSTNGHYAVNILQLIIV